MTNHFQTVLSISNLRRYNKVLILANLVLFGYLLHIVVDHRR